MGGDLVDNFHVANGSLPDEQNPYLFLPDSLRADYFVWNGSMTTPPCLPGPTQWVMAARPIPVDPATVRRYRQNINADPNNQLSPYGITAGTDGQVYYKKPEFHPYSGD